MAERRQRHLRGRNGEPRRSLHLLSRIHFCSGLVPRNSELYTLRPAYGTHRQDYFATTSSKAHRQESFKELVDPKQVVRIQLQTTDKHRLWSKDRTTHMQNKIKELLHSSATPRTTVAPLTS